MKQGFVVTANVSGVADAEV